MRSAIEGVGVAGQWGFDTRPESFSPSQPLRGTVEQYLCPLAHHPQTLRSRLVLLGILFHCPTFFFYTASQTSSRATLHALHIRIHGHSRSSTVALASSNFGHSVTGQGFSSRPSAGSLRFLPSPSGRRIPFFLSLRHCTLPSGVSASLAQDDYTSRRSARADIPILLRPAQSSRQQPSSCAVAVIQREQWQEEL